MHDANGRDVKVGDWVATPYPTDDLARLPALIQGAILGQVIAFGEDFQGEFVYLGGYDDGIVYGSEDIVTLGGLEFVICPECGGSWVFDVRMNAEEECPYCDALLLTPLLDWELDENLHNAKLEEAEYQKAFEGLGYPLHEV